MDEMLNVELNQDISEITSLINQAFAIRSEEMEKEMDHLTTKNEMMATILISMGEVVNEKLNSTMFDQTQVELMFE